MDNASDVRVGKAVAIVSEVDGPSTLAVDEDRPWFPTVVAVGVTLPLTLLAVAAAVDKGVGLGMFEMLP